MVRDTNKIADSIGKEKQRRALLKAIGAGTAFTIAGCLGGDDEGNGNGDGNGETATPAPGQEGTPSDTAAEAIDPKLDLGNSNPPEDDRKSPITPEGGGDITQYFFPLRTPFMANYHPNSDVDAIPIMVKEFSYDAENNVQTTVLNDEYDWKWHDGSDVTMEDLYYQWEIERLTDEKLDSYTPDFEEHVLESDTVLKSHFTEAQKKRAGMWTGEGDIDWRASVVKPWVEAVEDASNQDEVEDITQEGYQETLRSPDEYVGHGLFQVTEVTDRSVKYEKWDDHPFAENQNIQEIEQTFYGDQSARGLAYQNDEIDVGKTGPPTGVAMPDSMKTYEHRATSGMTITTNRRNPHLAKREVRQAVRYAISYTNIAANGQWGRFAGYSDETGLSTQLKELWITDETADILHDYGADSQPEKAVERMEEAGYERNSDDMWVDSDGEVIGFTTRTLGNGWFESESETSASNLRAVGFEVNVEGGDTGAFFDMWDQPINPDTGETQWDFIIQQGSGGGESLDPGEAFRNDYESKIWNDPEAVEAGTYPDEYAYGQEWEIELPVDGGVDPTGDTETINIRDLTEELHNYQTSRDRVEEITQVLARWWNYDAPAIYCTERAGGFTADIEDFIWDNYASRPTWNTEHAVGLYTGHHRGAPKNG